MTDDDILNKLVAAALELQAAVDLLYLTIREDDFPEDEDEDD